MKILLKVDVVGEEKRGAVRFLDIDFDLNFPSVLIKIPDDEALRWVDSQELAPVLNFILTGGHVKLSLKVRVEKKNKRTAEEFLEFDLSGETVVLIRVPGDETTRVVDRQELAHALKFVLSA